MSYPRKPHILIVEDEAGPRQAWRDQLKLLESSGIQMVEPVIACSYEDGLAKLKGSNIYHVVILDLGLPEKTHGVVEEGTDPGIQLLKTAAERDAYPIPAILVISARLGGKTGLPQLRELLGNFWYGQFINKDDPNIGDEISKALRAALKYCDVGLHVRDTGKREYPGLSAREDDLIRRCVLEQQHCLGVDLEWWGAERAYSVSEGAEIPWKKVLIGQFLLDEGMGVSRPTFFKLEPAESAGFAQLSANVLGKKLRHIKVVHNRSGRTRGLLVTESVSDSRPIALDEFLRMDSKVVIPAVQHIVRDIIVQLDNLGATSEMQRPVKQILWQYHRLETIKEGLRRFAPAKTPVGPEVTDMFQFLAACDNHVWVNVKQCNHGDLHSRNVAVDMADSAIRAFIFDAGAMKSDVNIRDLAQLEVSSLLFQQPQQGESLVEHCSRLYSGSVEPPLDLDFTAGSGIARNTLAFIAEIRRQALAKATSSAYALLVFDQALIQIGGVAIQSSRNKIHSSEEAWKFISLATGWLPKVAPDVFGASP